LTDDRSTDDSDGGGISVVLDLCFRVMFYYHIRSPLCHEAQQWEYRGVSFWSNHHCQAPQRTPRPEMFLDVGQFFVDKRWMSCVVHPTMRSISPFLVLMCFFDRCSAGTTRTCCGQFFNNAMGCYGFCLIFAPLCFLFLDSDLLTKCQKTWNICQLDTLVFSMLRHSMYGIFAYIHPVHILPKN